MFKSNRVNKSTALDKLEAARLRLRKKYFSPPKQPWQDVDGLSVAYGDDIEPRTEFPLDPSDQSPLANAIREKFPTSSPRYWASIARRYRELHEGMTEEESVAAVLKGGHSSPEDAIRSHAIRKRKYIGFGPHRISFKQWVTKLAMVTDDPTGDFIDDTRRLIRFGKWPKKPVASLDALLSVVRRRTRDKDVLGAATDTWRRYQYWTGVKP